MSTHNCIRSGTDRYIEPSAASPEITPPVVPEAKPQGARPSSKDGLEKGFGVEVAHVTIFSVSISSAETAGRKEHESKSSETSDWNRGIVNEGEEEKNERTA